MEEKSTIRIQRNLEQNRIFVIVFTAPLNAIVVQFLKHEIHRITDRIGRKSEKDSSACVCPYS